MWTTLGASEGIEMRNYAKVESRVLPAWSEGIGSGIKRVIRRQSYVRLGSPASYENGIRVRKLKIVRLGGYGGHARRQLKLRLNSSIAGKSKSGSILQRLKTTYLNALVKISAMPLARKPKVSPALELGLGSRIDFKLAAHEKLYLEYVKRSIADGRGY